MWTTWKAATARGARGVNGAWQVRARAFVFVLMLPATVSAPPAVAAEGKVYRCEHEGSVVYTDIGCGLLPPVRLGRPVGTVDPLTEGERALLERMQRGAAGAHGRARKGDSARTRSRANAAENAAANARGARCAATAGADATCADREPPARRPRAKGGKPRRIVSTPAPARASSMYARGRAGTASGPPTDGPAPEVRRVAPGRVAAPSRR